MELDSRSRIWIITYEFVSTITERNLEIFTSFPGFKRLIAFQSAHHETVSVWIEFNYQTFASKITSLLEFSHVVLKRAHAKEIESFFSIPYDNRIDIDAPPTSADDTINDCTNRLESSDPVRDKSTSSSDVTVEPDWELYKQYKQLKRKLTDIDDELGRVAKQLKPSMKAIAQDAQDIIDMV